jgi:micrococcal nuclease
MAAPEESGRMLIVDVDKRAETVTLKNTGDAPVDLAGWRLLSVNSRQTHPISGVPAAGREQAVSRPRGGHLG